MLHGGKHHCTREDFPTGIVCALSPQYAGELASLYLLSLCLELLKPLFSGSDSVVNAGHG
jgi:hypothetical protein